MNKYALTLPLVILSVFLGYFGSSLRTYHGYALVAVTLVAIVTMFAYMFLKRKKRNEGKSIGDKL